MGIRTKGFTKASQKSGEVVAEVKVSPLVLPKQESTTENKVDSCDSIEEDKKASSEVKPEISKPATRVNSNISRSPLKIRTPTSMARLGGMKVAARKLKKHRKKSIIVQSANKILRSSIKSNKTRRTCRLEEKPRANGAALPSRISTRTCVRRSSREGIPEAPLRTVELIKRPLELREPATKLLYMASLGLYPRTGESDMTPIVVIKELNCSPGKKNGVRKSLELLLIPYHKRFLDLANHDKESISENIMPAGKHQRRDTRKTSPSNKNDKIEAKKPAAAGRKTPVNAVSPPLNPAEPPKSTPGLHLTENGKSKTLQQQHQQPKKKTPPKVNSSISPVLLPVPISKQASSLDLTTAPIATGKLASSFTHLESGKKSPNSNSKSLLKSNISPPLKYTKDTLSLPLPLNLTASFPTKIESPKPITTESLLASACSVTQAMNLIMSNITILPTTNTAASRKRCANDSDSRIEEMMNSKYFTIQNASILADKKPPKKRPKRASAEKNTRYSFPTAVPMPISVSASNSLSVGGPFLQPTQSQNADEALNLCMKKINSEPLASPVIQLPPKLQLDSNVNIQKVNNINGSKPLNLIIPRPPPLMKAPLEATNFANCTQNLQPMLAAKAKAQPKKARKSRPKNNQFNQSSLQVQESLPVLPSPPLLANTDTTVHAKSLLKCMNGEENTLGVREIGESLDSVKTMLSRLQTRIGPAVNGVHLITTE